MLDVKCCKCPSRDLTHEERIANNQREVSAADCEKLNQVYIFPVYYFFCVKFDRQNVRKLEC